MMLFNDNDVLKYSTFWADMCPNNQSCSKCKYTRFKQTSSRCRISSNPHTKWNGSNWLNGNVAFSEITGKPTTLASYGITDALKIGDDYTGSVFADDPNPTCRWCKWNYTQQIYPVHFH